MSLWIYDFQRIFPNDVANQIVKYVGSPFPETTRLKIQMILRHLQKRYCKNCGEYVSIHERHRHFTRQKMFRYIPKYERYLRVHDILYISKTNFRITTYTPYDIIVVWQNIRAYYGSFRKCLLQDRNCKIQSCRDVYFTDVGISSNASFWYVDEWNSLYPKMMYDDDEHRFKFQESDWLWTPNLNSI